MLWGNVVISVTMSSGSYISIDGGAVANNYNDNYHPACPDVDKNNPTNAGKYLSVERQELVWLPEKWIHQGNGITVTDYIVPVGEYVCWKVQEDDYIWEPFQPNVVRYCPTTDNYQVGLAYTVGGNNYTQTFSRQAWGDYTADDSTGLVDNIYLDWPNDQIHVRKAEGTGTITNISFKVLTQYSSKEQQVSYSGTPLWATYSNGTLNLYTSNPNA